MRAALSWRGVLWLGFFGAILAAWAVLFVLVWRAGPAGASVWASLCIPAQGAGVAALVAMWALMVAAMMLPTLVPALRTFLDLGAAGASTPGTAMALLGGYGTVWLGAAILGAAGQAALGQAGLLDAGGRIVAPLVTAALLAGAGLYQFSALKAACLSKCRRPMTFFLERWRPGAGAAFGMGARLGALCFGCCWALMALAFVGGTMNLLWMGAATLFMVAEKLPQVGRWIGAPAGWALIGAGGAVAVLAVT